MSGPKVERIGPRSVRWTFGATVTESGGEALNAEMMVCQPIKESTEMNPRLCVSCRTQTFYSHVHGFMICQCDLERERQAYQSTKMTNQSTLFQVDAHEAEFLQRCLEAYRSLDEVTITIDGISRMVNITPRRSLNPSRYPSTKTHPALTDVLAGTIADFSEAKRAAFSPLLRKRRG